MNQLSKIISSVKYVSFDIFDTAILRSVQKPVDLFLVVYEKYHQTTHDSINRFKEKRIEAERLARDKVWLDSQRTEVTLDEIYKSLIENFSLSKNQASQLKLTELQVEQAFCQVNPYILEIFDYCLRQGKQVIFSSDIYLPEELIAAILSDAGYQGYDRLFISSTLGLTKSTGKLYQHILKELKCSSGEVLHIGDNYDPDVKMAEKQGINSFYYEKCLARAKGDPQIYQRLNLALEGMPEIEKSIYLATIINRYYSQRALNTSSLKNDFWHQQGYLFVGILYFSFIQWLIFNIKDQGSENVYFLSRDGYIMQKVYERLRRIYPDIPVSSYLYASRRALNIPAIEDLDEQDIDFLVSGTSRLTVKAFLQRIGIDAHTYVNECRQVGFESLDQLVRTGTDYANLRALYKTLKTPILAIAQAEKKILKMYFEQTGLLDADNITIADIGWHGSLQRSIETLSKLMGKSLHINGYYLGTFPAAEKLVEQGHKIQGYLCDQGNPHKYQDLIKQSVEIFEFIHSAPHGSVLKFKQEEAAIEGVFDNDVDEDGKLKKAQKLQQGALDFIRDFLPAWSALDYKLISKEVACAPINSVLTQPTFEEAKNYGDLEHAEGYGDVYVKRYLAKPEKLSLRLFSPHKLIQDYRHSFWRAGFKKRCLYFWR